MSGFYKERDADFIDYELWAVQENPRFRVRGPRLKKIDIKKRNYFSVLGAAETFGVHAVKPYGALLSMRLGLPCLNLGRGGAGPAFFCRPDYQGIIDYVNKGKFLILNFMSGRHTNNSLIKCIDGTVNECEYNGEIMKADNAWQLIIEKYWDDKKFLKNLILETRQSYINDYLQLIKLVAVPVILFYFSQGKSRYSINWRKKDVYWILGQFPHFVDHKTIKEIKKKSPAVLAECISKRGIPYTLKDKTGKEKPLWNADSKQFIWKHSYYPSPEMHEDAANVLEPVCRKILKKMNRTARG